MNFETKTYHKAYHKIWYRAHRKARVAQILAYRKRYPEVTILMQINQRCRNPKCAAYPDYGGRGIQNFIRSTKELITLIGRRPAKGYYIDRINNNGHYESGNIRWVTSKESAQNRREKKCQTS